MILITGGAGYIGSHTATMLLQNGYDITIFDNLETSSISTIKTIKEISGKKFSFIKGDLRSEEDLKKVFKLDYDCVIHFAAYKSVVESMQIPDRYYENNVLGTYNLLKSMLLGRTRNIIFSSSCSVYGNPTKLPVDECNSFDPLSPYARTKACVEYMLEDYKNLGINSVRLRYFNAAGAHESGKLGENPEIMPNIIPRIFGVVNKGYSLKVYGNKFPTRDGYQIRDYIHVQDLVDAHLKAMNYLKNKTGSYAFNIGTGRGTTVKELVDEVEKVTGKQVPYEVVSANLGEAIEVYADASKAKRELGWEAKYDYHDIIRDAHKWYQNNIL